MILMTIMWFQRSSEYEPLSSQGQSERDYTIMKLKTDLRRSEQRVDDLNMEVRNVALRTGHCGVLLCSTSCFHPFILCFSSFVFSEFSVSLFIVEKSAKLSTYFNKINKQTAFRSGPSKLEWYMAQFLVCGNLPINQKKVFYLLFYMQSNY